MKTKEQMKIKDRKPRKRFPKKPIIIRVVTYSETVSELEALDIFKPKK